MYQSLGHLLKTRRFLPLFVTQFLSAFNDNLFKFALVLFIKFQMTDLSADDSKALTTLAAGIFVLPFFLFSSLGGQLADKHEKSGLIQIIRMTEIPIMALAAVGFYLDSALLLLMVLFLMGTKSAFFGPLKYSILPEQLKRNELIGGNGLVEMATFLSILLGTILGGVLIVGTVGSFRVAALTITLAVLGYIASLFILKKIPRVPKLKVNWNFLGEALRISKRALSVRPIRISIFGISWFWLVGATFLAQFPNYTKDTLFGNESVATLLLFSLSAGIGVGSIACNRLLKSQVSAKFAPWAVFFFGVFCIDIFFASGQAVTGSATHLLSISEFLNYPANWRILADMILIAVSGGVFIVPLYSILQTTSDEKNRARMIAANNIMNSLFMVLSSLVTLVLFKIGFEVVHLFLTLGIINLGISWYFYRNRGWEKT